MSERGILGQAGGDEAVKHIGNTGKTRPQWTNQLHRILTMPIGRPRSMQSPSSGAPRNKSTKLRLGEKVGIDIGNEGIKLVVVNLGKGGPRITKFASMALPKPIDGNDGVPTVSQIVEALTMLVKQSHLRQRKVVIGYPGANLLIRHVDLPAMSADELAGVLKWDMDQYIPLSKAESVVDFAIIPPKGDDRPDGTMRVLLVGAQRQPVIEALQVLKDVRLTPLAMDIAPLAAWRAIHYGQEFTPGIEVIVDLGGTITRISIFVDGILQMVRSIPQGGRHLSSALSTACAFGCDEVERLRHDQIDSYPESQRQVRLALAPLVEEIVRSIEFFLYRNREMPLQAVHLVGGTALQTGLQAMLEHDLLPLVEQGATRTKQLVRLFELPTSVAIDPSLLDQHREIAPVYATALGLALWEVVV